MTWYELTIGITLLLLSLMVRGKSITLPVFYITFVLLDNFRLMFSISILISINAMLIIYIIESKSHHNTDSFEGIVKKNKRLFPFSGDIIIAVYKSPYTYIYLDRGSAIRLRCSLKELINVQGYLTKISRNIAISPDANVIGKNRFTYQEQELTSDMIITWGNNSNKKNNSQIRS